MLNIFQYRNGLQILPAASLLLDEMGELQVLQSDGKLYYHNGTTISPFITEDSADVITNKKLVDNSTFIVDVVDNTIRIGFNVSGTTGTTTTLTTTQTANRVITFPDATDTLIGRDTSDTLTNKIISGLVNTINNVSLTTGVTGVLPIANGGTSANNKTAAFNALSPMTTGGDLIYGGAAGTGLRLTNGSNGQVLTSSGGSAAPTWQTPSPGFQNPMTTIGDLIIGDTGGAAIRLGATTNGFILTLSGGSPVWAANAGGSAVSTIGTIDSQSKSANGLVISGTSLFAQTADASFPGMVSIGTQTFQGAKTFSTSISTPSLLATAIVDNGAGLSITPALNQNLTFATSGAGRIIFSAAQSIDLPESSAPSNPAAGFSNLFFKTDHLLYSKDSTGAERLIGSGGGSGGVNFITLDTAFAPTKSNDSNAENSVGNWITYNDGAVAVPIDMTGGVAGSLTLSRTTTVGEVLDGSGSFKIVKTASNAQGQGTSVVANIPLGYRGKRASISLPIKIISGNLVQGDLKAYAYDVTNSQVLTPEHNDIFSTGSVTAAFDVPLTCAQIRFGFHFATTSALAVTFSFDDVVVGPQSINTNSNVSDFTSSVAFTVDNFGTITNSDFRSRIVGDTLEVYGKFNAGTPSASPAAINLPTGYIIDTSKITADTNTQLLGLLIRGGAGNVIASNGSGPWALFYDGSNTGKIFIALDLTATAFNKSNGSALAASGDFLTFSFKVPIAGRSSNTVVADSGIFRISDILANGTRVTGTPPALLGEYRSYLRNANAASYTETNGSPTASPSSADGILVYEGNAYNVADTNNQPTRYEIFVGKNKAVKFQFYAATGRTGFIDISPSSLAGFDYGYFTNYDPTTGIAAIVANRVDAGGTVHRAGTSGDGGNNVANSYFDIIVANNEFQIQLQIPPNEIYITSGNGMGSTNTAIRRFNNTQKSTGSAITYVDSATLGASFTINETGRYSIDYYDGTNSAALNANSAISVNASGTALTLSPESNLPFPNKLGFMFNGFSGSSSTPTMFLHASVNLNIGDIIRAHFSGTPINSVDNTTWFRITKVS